MYEQEEMFAGRKETDEQEKKTFENIFSEKKKENFSVFLLCEIYLWASVCVLWLCACVHLCACVAW